MDSGTSHQSLLSLLNTYENDINNDVTLYNLVVNLVNHYLKNIVNTHTLGIIDVISQAKIILSQHYDTWGQNLEFLQMMDKTYHQFRGQLEKLYPRTVKHPFYATVMDKKNLPFGKTTQDIIDMVPAHAYVLRGELRRARESALIHKSDIPSSPNTSKEYNMWAIYCTRLQHVFRHCDFHKSDKIPSWLLTIYDVMT